MTTRPSTTSPSSPGRLFHMFPYLHEDLKLSIVSYVGDAPFESLPENYPKSSLTNTLPLVNKQLRSLTRANCLWKAAIIRQVKKEPANWRRALLRIIEDEDRHTPTTTTTASSSVGEEEDAELLVERVHKGLGEEVTYKTIYQHVVSKHLRFKGPIFCMRGHVQLTEPYGLHFFEPRYRLLIAEVMRSHSQEAKSGGRVRQEALFVHANHAGPLAPATPATLVDVARCHIYPDGRADVLLVPIGYVWLEKVWRRPNSGDLYYAQCLKMTATATQEMNKLARQEALASVMDMLTVQFQGGEREDDDDDDDDEHLEHNEIDIDDEDADFDLEHAGFDVDDGHHDDFDVEDDDDDDDDDEVDDEE